MDWLFGCCGCGKEKKEEQEIVVLNSPEEDATPQKTKSILRHSTSDDQPPDPTDATKKEIMKNEVKRFIKAGKKGMPMSLLLAEGGGAIPVVFKLNISGPMWFSLTHTGGDSSLYLQVPMTKFNSKPEKCSVYDCRYAVRLSAVAPERAEGNLASKALDKHQLALVFDEESERERFWSCIQVTRVMAEKRANTS